MSICHPPVDCVVSLSSAIRNSRTYDWHQYEPPTLLRERRRNFVCDAWDVGLCVVYTSHVTGKEENVATSRRQGRSEGRQLTVWKTMGMASTRETTHRMKMARRALPTVHTYLARIGCRMA